MAGRIEVGLASHGGVEADTTGRTWQRSISAQRGESTARLPQPDPLLRKMAACKRGSSSVSVPYSLAYLALEVCGDTGSAVADLLGVRPSAVYRAAQRGRATRGRWEGLLPAGETKKNIRKQRPV